MFLRVRIVVERLARQLVAAVVVPTYSRTPDVWRVVLLFAIVKPMGITSFNACTFMNALRVHATRHITYCVLNNVTTLSIRFFIRLYALVIEYAVHAHRVSATTDFFSP